MLTTTRATCYVLLRNTLRRGKQHSLVRTRNKSCVLGMLRCCAYIEEGYMG